MAAAMHVRPALLIPLLFTLALLSLAGFATAQVPTDPNPPNDPNGVPLADQHPDGPPPGPPPLPRDPALHVRIESGEIAGMVRVRSNVSSGQDAVEYKPGNVRVFRGIPYAAPPVGDLRWRPPQAVVPWEGVRRATSFGSICPQPDNPVPTFRRIGGGNDVTESEDCLFANVWTPAVPAAAEKLPVMVWIHGGYYTVGFGSEANYEPFNLARRGVVIVTFNYRLGPLGYFAHPDLSAESPDHVSGNYGLMDQAFLLQWVQRNIQAFGGDPGNVTVFGQDAGAGSIARLMVSPKARGLFHKAILQSAGPLGRNRLLTTDVGRMISAEKMGERLQDKLNAAGLTEMRETDAITLLRTAAPAIISTGDRYAPVVDGLWVPEDTQQSWAAGKQMAIPLLVGTNADDGSVFVTGAPVETVSSYETAVNVLFGQPAADELLKLYPAKDDGDSRVAARHLVTGTNFVYPAALTIEAQAKLVPNSVFEYHFTRIPNTRRAQMNGCHHGVEIVYAFDNIPPPDAPFFGSAFSTDDRAISGQMADAWTAFAKTGNPSTPGLTWPAVNNTRPYVEFGRQAEVKNDLFSQTIAVMQKLGAP